MSGYERREDVEKVASLLHGGCWRRLTGAS